MEHVKSQSNSEIAISAKTIAITSLAITILTLLWDAFYSSGRLAERTDVTREVITELKISMKEGLQGLEDRMDKRFEQIDRRFEQIDRRFDQMDEKFERLEDKMDKGFQRTDNKVDSLKNSLHKLDIRVTKIEQKKN